MIGKIAATTSLLLITYMGYLAYVAPPSSKGIQYQWQENVVKAQRFLYDTHPNKNVVVGTSLSARIVMDSLPETTLLSFHGLSIFDGLEILLRRRTYPEKLLIETNIMSRPANEKFLHSLTSPLFYYSRKWLPVLRDENQPIGALGKKLRPAFGYVLANVKKIAPHEREEHKGSVFERMLKIQIESYSTAPDDAEMGKLFAELKRCVDIFEAGGTEVIFFEMPVNCALVNLPKAQVTKAYFSKTFGSNKYRYVTAEDCRNYSTVDGIHLTRDEARMFSSYFKEHIGI